MWTASLSKLCKLSYVRRPARTLDQTYLHFKCPLGRDLAVYLTVYLAETRCCSGNTLLSQGLYSSFTQQTSAFLGQGSLSCSLFVTDKMAKQRFLQWLPTKIAVNCYTRLLWHFQATLNIVGKCNFWRKQVLDTTTTTTRTTTTATTTIIHIFAVKLDRKSWRGPWPSPDHVTGKQVYTKAPMHTNVYKKGEQINVYTKCEPWNMYTKCVQKMYYMQQICTTNMYT